ncbi:MAG: hypothetical protein ACP6IU_07105 [Candidatus Asgardarchaeia archaeon]
MGRRRKGRKIEKRVKPKLPTVFECPNCGHRSVYVEMNKKEGFAIVSCGSCGLTAQVKIYEISEPVDAYGDFVDKYYAGEIDVESSEIESEDEEV